MAFAVIACEQQTHFWSSLLSLFSEGEKRRSEMRLLFAGYCCEGRTQYVTDSPKGCIQPVTPLDGTVEFLTHLGDLFCNFGIHLRGQTGMDSTLVDVQTCLQHVTKF